MALGAKETGGGAKEDGPPRHDRTRNLRGRRTDGPKRRVVLYSPGMVGLGHMRRNLLIAVHLSRQPDAWSPLLIAEAREAAVFSVPAGIDSITLPALSKDSNGHGQPRSLGVSLEEVIRLRARVIRTALDAYAPDLLLVDHLPRGAYSELDASLEALKSRGTRLVLGLRPVLGDPETVRREWQRARHLESIRRYYTAILIYGDRSLYDPADEYDWPDDIRRLVRCVGYLDPSRRLDYAPESATSANILPELPDGRMMLCMVGGGQDGAMVAETFARTPLPDDAYGVIVAGPFMPPEIIARLERESRSDNRVYVLRMVDEAAHLLARADRVVAMAGYNSLTEVLAFGKHALIIPRNNDRREQMIHARALAEAGAVTLMTQEEMSPEMLGKWLASPHSAPTPTSLIDFNGLDGIAAIVRELTVDGDETRRPNRFGGDKYAIH